MKAIVLSAGFGTRLGDLTREIPKPMLDVNGVPILGRILANLKEHGFTQIAINLHFKPELIRDYFGDGRKFGLEITYSYEQTLLGTAGGAKNFESFFQNESLFLVHYGDVVTNQDLSQLVAAHKEKNALATLLLHERAKSNSVVSLDEERRIVGFLERPSEEERRHVKSPWVNSGVTICSPEILTSIPANTTCDLPRDIFPKLIHTRRLFGFPLSGYRCAVDSPERLQQLHDKLNEPTFSYPKL
jgi:mannose-1-phosphate guanylyltransferase/phosphomannomutase